MMTTCRISGVQVYTKNCCLQVHSCHHSEQQHEDFLSEKLRLPCAES